MSDLLAVKLIARTEDTLELKLRIINGDQTHFPYSLSFANMLIEEIEELELGDPLEQTEEEEEQDLFYDAVVKVEVKDIQFLEGSEERDYDLGYTDLLYASDEDKDLFWTNPHKMPEATLLITVNYPRAIAHIEEGIQWNTTAYEELEDPSDSYWTTLRELPYIHERK